jgi:hypothetical protein
MAARPKITPEETAELQRLYSELPWAIAEASKAAAEDRPAGQTREQPQDGDEKVDTIIRRICQLTDESGD